MRTALAALLAVQALCGLGASAADAVQPFSQSGAIARVLAAPELAALPLVGEPDAILSPVATLLRRPIYFVNADRTGTFTVFKKRDHAFNPAHLAERLSVPGPVLWLTNRPFRDDDPAIGAANLAGVPVQWKRLAVTDDAIRADERYWLYELRRAPLK